MARVRITIETNGGETTVEDYVGHSVAGDDKTYVTLASTIMRVVAATAGPDHYDEAIATLRDLLVQNGGTRKTSPLLEAAAEMRGQIKQDR